MSMGLRIKTLRKKAKLTQKQIADRLGMGSSNFGHIENDRVTPSSSDLQKIADILHTSTDYLLGRTDEKETPQPYYALTDKDERDIAKDLERIMDNLESKEALSFYGEELELDAEAKEILKASIEQSMRLAKQASKKKFTPKKYR